MKKLFALACLLICVNSFAQTRLTIQSPNEKCASVLTSIRDHAFGDQGFWAGRLAQGDGTYLTVRSFLQFDLSSIPAGSFVNWARLSLFSLGGSFGPNSSILRRITSQWDPVSITWNTQPSTARRGTVRLPMSKTGNQDYKNINVWTLVQAMVDSPATSFGFAIRLDSDASGTASRSMMFISPGFNKPHFDPKLVMEYTAPGMQKKVTTLSIDLGGTSTALSIYPNPSNGIFNCKVKTSSTDNMTLRIIDMLGRTVYSQSVNPADIEIPVSLPASSRGTYFAILQANNAIIESQQLEIN